MNLQSVFMFLLNIENHGLESLMGMDLVDIQKNLNVGRIDVLCLEF